MKSMHRLQQFVTTSSFSTAMVMLLLVVPKISLAADETTGKIDAVTVYRGQALVTRLIEISGPAGLREIVVTGLPEQIIPGSIYAESANGVQVRSVRYRQRPVSEDIREEVRQLDDQLAELNDKSNAITRQKALTKGKMEYLSRLEEFTATTANLELGRGVLDAETLKTLTLFQFEQRQQLLETDMQHDRDLLELTEKIDLLQRQRNLLSGRSARTVREAIVFVNLEAASGELRLRYLVNAASWAPSYNLRTSDQRTDVLVEYNALIQQMSGEDWTDVAMTLSTASPSLVARAPVMEPLAISLKRGGGNQDPSTDQGGALPRQTQNKQEYIDQRLSLNLQKSQFEAERGSNAYLTQTEEVTGDSIANFDSLLNRVACDLQLLDLTETGRIVARTAMPTIPEGVSVTYQLSDRTTLPSRADQQLIQIAAVNMAGEFYRSANPVLTDFVYEEATVTNSGKTVLLSGPYLSYVAGQFVGQGELPTVAAGENFTIGFGIDSSLRASRELIDRNESVQGGNRVVTFTYQLAVENFGSEPASIRLFDRIPNSKEGAVKVTLGSPAQPLSTDSNYVANQRKNGLLRWDVDVPAQATGTERLNIDYQFTLEHDRQFEIAGIPVSR